MSAISELQSIKTQLNSLFSEDLATYTTPSGNTFPAIYVGIVPNDWRVGDGLEVNIQAAPDMTSRPLYQSAQVDAVYIVYLTHNLQYVLPDLASKVIKYYGDARVGSVIADNALQRFQIRLEIPESYAL